MLSGTRAAGRGGRGRALAHGSPVGPGIDLCPSVTSPVRAILAAGQFDLSDPTLIEQGVRCTAAMHTIAARGKASHHRTASGRATTRPQLGDQAWWAV